MMVSPHLYAFEDSLLFAKRLAQALKAKVSKLEAHRFPDGETLVRVVRPPQRHAVLVRSLFDPNSKLFEVALAADALRRAGAHSVTLVAPYLPYMRQDRVFRTGEPISQRVLGHWLGTTFDRVLTIEAHLHRVSSLTAVISPTSASLSAAPVLSRWIEKSGRNCVVVGPDEESEPWVRSIASEAGLPWIVGTKRRVSDRKVIIRMPRPPRCTRAVIVDDIASSGVTLATATRSLLRMGIRRVDAVVVHAIFAPSALARIHSAGAGRVVSCDTIPHSTNLIRTAELFVPTVLEALER